MRSFQPSIFYIENCKCEEKYYSTYALLKKHLKDVISGSDDGQVTVYRYRKGQWGEWFEKWSLDKKGKPVILKEGWM